MNLENVTIRLAELERIVENKFPKTAMAHKTHIVETIQNIVCDEFNLTRHALLSERKLAPYVWPRHIAMALAYEFSGIGSEGLAPLFDRLDHCTILHACRRVRTEESLRKARAQQVSKIRQRVVKALVN